MLLGVGLLDVRCALASGRETGVLFQEPARLLRWGAGGGRQDDAGPVRRHREAGILRVTGEDIVSSPTPLTLCSSSLRISSFASGEISCLLVLGSE